MDPKELEEIARMSDFDDRCEKIMSDINSLLEDFGNEDDPLRVNPSDFLEAVRVTLEARGLSV